MLEFDLKRLQNIELQILKDVTAFCDQHGIRYFLYGGTLLGAARHQGFIPWDDDIDIWMDQKSYRRFLKLAKALPDRYFVQHYKTDRKLCYPWTKVMLNSSLFISEGFEQFDIRQGIHIDIFMMNGIADNPLRAKIQRKALKLKKRLLRKYYAIDVKNEDPGIAAKIVPEFLRRPLISFTERLSEIDPFRCRSCYGNDNANISMAKTYPSEMFLAENTIALPFEDGAFSAPKAYDEFLQITYGDWQTLPPEDQRRGHYPVKLDFGHYGVQSEEEK